MNQADNGIRSYVLRQGRMTIAQKRAFDGDGNRFLLPFTGNLYQCGDIFKNDRPLLVEIGFGMGQATWQIARMMPDKNFLGIEVHRPGVGKLIGALVDNAIDNVRIVNHDAVEVFEKCLAPESVAGIHLFYPDPWPKKRHHKRRIIRPGLVDLLASRLKIGGYLYFVTDIEDYAAAALETLSSTSSLRNSVDGYCSSQPWRPETKFEARASQAGRPRRELFFLRVKA